jgi:hypothetical protein
MWEASVAEVVPLSSSAFQLTVGTLGRRHQTNASSRGTEYINVHDTFRGGWFDEIFVLLDKALHPGGLAGFSCGLLRCCFSFKLCLESGRHGRAVGCVERGSCFFVVQQVLYFITYKKSWRKKYFP